MGAGEGGGHLLKNLNSGLVAHSWARCCKRRRHILSITLLSIRSERRHAKRRRTQTPLARPRGFCSAAGFDARLFVCLPAVLVLLRSSRSTFSYHEEIRSTKKKQTPISFTRLCHAVCFSFASWHFPVSKQANT